MKDTPDMTAQELAEACAREMWNSDSASQRLGMVLKHISCRHETIMCVCVKRSDSLLAAFRRDANVLS